MINLKLRTEYSFRDAFGPVARVVEVAGGKAAGIADDGTWGFVAWQKCCRKAGVKPIYGLRLAVAEAVGDRKSKTYGVTLLAKNKLGLVDIYRACTEANKNAFYGFRRWVPRISEISLMDHNSENTILLIGEGGPLDWDGSYLEMSPGTPRWNEKIKKKKNIVFVSDNYYPTPRDRGAYEVMAAESAQNIPTAQYILDEWEAKIAIDDMPEIAITNTDFIASQIEEFDLPVANNVTYKSDRSLGQICREAAPRLNIDLADEIYSARLERELQLISDKGFEDYFYVLADMCDDARSKMLVGPARGSSAGSLVCYLTGITTVDPIKHDLIFERFIDLNRADLPDIDVDFPDTQRDEVLDRMKFKYGESCVARIGTISRYKPKSVLTDVGRSFKIPVWEMNELKDSIIERSGGDARAAFCIQDTLETLETGIKMLAKYPEISVASELEGHARHSGVHAAGLVVLSDAITNYCSISKDGTAQIDKKDAEELNILKIDALGLRTLSVLSDAIIQAGVSREELLSLPLDDEATLATFNKNKFAGIFQFEGYALKSLSKQLTFDSFDDIVAVTTLARPGPLHSGGATEFISRRMGRKPVSYLHALAEESTKDTYGVIIFQEQVMTVGRLLGKLSWEDVSELRKAMSKSLGEEFFNKYWLKFKAGAEENNIDEKEADRIWKSMVTFGSWAFNKSHAVSYAMISYWCGWLKTHYPLEFAAACLRHAKDSDQTIKILRELKEEGLEYVAFDKDLSEMNWSVKEGRLVGGLVGAKGIGPKIAERIMSARVTGRALAPGVLAKMDNPDVPYIDVFQTKTLWGDLYENPEEHGIFSGSPNFIWDIAADQKRGIVFIGKLVDKNLRDLNEYGNVVKRGGKLVKRNNLFLNLTFEDDTDSIIATIDRWLFPKIGKKIVDEDILGDWFLIKGDVRWEGKRKINVTKIRKLN